MADRGGVRKVSRAPTPRAEHRARGRDRGPSPWAVTAGRDRGPCAEAEPLRRDPSAVDGAPITCVGFLARIPAPPARRRVSPAPQRRLRAGRRAPSRGSTLSSWGSTRPSRGSTLPSWGSRAPSRGTYQTRAVRSPAEPGRGSAEQGKPSSDLGPGLGPIIQAPRSRDLDPASQQLAGLRVELNRRASCCALRHRFASHLLEHGHDIRAAQEPLGYRRCGRQGDLDALAGLRSLARLSSLDGLAVRPLSRTR
jgi:hypothetical protein